VAAAKDIPRAALFFSQLSFGIDPVNDIPSLTVLISGRGSNLVALHGGATNYRIGHVISNTPDAPGLSWAEQAGIPRTIVARANYESLTAFKTALLEAVLLSRPDIVALAGFMVVLNAEFTETFKGRLINIHPSLLPKFPGLDTHARALTAGEVEHGATVHFVDAGVDTGLRIAQAVVPILPGDDEKTLASRTLTVEHTLYPWVAATMARGGIHFAPERVRYDEQALLEARQLSFRVFA
jgi:phosphoribosylglycinamide formyltransferase-1